ncbi:unnamed protein product, partial [Prorocentrum cordatum]
MFIWEWDLAARLHGNGKGSITRGCSIRVGALPARRNWQGALADPWGKVLVVGGLLLLAHREPAGGEGGETLLPGWLHGADLLTPGSSEPQRRRNGRRGSPARAPWRASRLRDTCEMEAEHLGPA